MFPAIGPDGEPDLDSEKGLSGERINAIVQDYAVRAGLAQRPGPGGRNPYGAHSLRAGFVTEALRDGKLTLGQVQDITGHRSLDVLMRYRREADIRRRNPLTRLLADLGPDKSAPTA